MISTQLPPYGYQGRYLNFNKESKTTRYQASREKILKDTVILEILSAHKPSFTKNELEKIILSLVVNDFNMEVFKSKYRILLRLI